jgi:hypothetical protein
MKKIILAIILLSATRGYTASQLTVLNMISSDRTTVHVTVQNDDNKDMFCKELYFNTTYVQDNFNERVASINILKKNVYVPAGEKLEIAVGKSETDQIRKKYPKAIIDTSKTGENLNCQTASFADYCEFSPKTEDENYTLSKIKEEAGKNNCTQVEGKIGTRLSLRRKELKELKPLGYLKNLKRLDLRRNQITNVVPLVYLEFLEEIYLDHNPVSDVKILLNLPYIESIFVRDTKVKTNGSNKNSPIKTNWPMPFLE